MRTLYRVNRVILDASLWHDEDVDDLIALANVYHFGICLYAQTVWDTHNITIPALLEGFDIIYGDQLREEMNAKKHQLFLKKDHDGISYHGENYADLRAWIDAKSRYDQRMIRFCNVLITVFLGVMLWAMVAGKTNLTPYCVIGVILLYLLPYGLGVRGTGAIDFVIDALLGL